MNQLNEITDQMSLEELMEVKGGVAEMHTCILNSAVTIKCDSGAIKAEDLKQLDDTSR